MRAIRVGLLDHMGFGNMGDAAIHESFIENIRRRLPGVDIVTFSENPNDSRERHGTASYPIGWNQQTQPEKEHNQDAGLKSGAGFKVLLQKWCRPAYELLRAIRNLGRRLRHLTESYKIVRSLDILVIAGGGQLCELWGGSWSHPYNIFKFVLLARIANRPAYIVGVGADLLEKPLSKLFAKWSVELADYASFRSAESQDCIRRLGVKRETSVCPDPAYAIDLSRHLIVPPNWSHEIRERAGKLLRPRIPDARPSKVVDASGRGLRVGMNPMGFCDPRIWPRQEEDLYIDYLDKMTQVGTWLLGQGYEVELFTSDIVVDEHALNDLRVKLLMETPREYLSNLRFQQAQTLTELLRQMANLDFVLTPKFHGVVFAHLLEKPVIALSYLPKIDHQMNTIGISKYCFDVERFTVEELKHAFLSLRAETGDVAELFEATGKVYSASLTDEFDRLVKGIDRPQRTPLGRGESLANSTMTDDLHALVGVGGAADRKEH